MQRRRVGFRFLCATLTLCGVFGWSPDAVAGLMDVFSISLEQPVSNGLPGEGAGNIEVSGATDVYTFTVDPGTSVYFDELSAPCNLQWKCEASDASVIFNNNALCATDPGTKLLSAGGTYTITVYSNTGGTGTYSFVLWLVNPVQSFSIDFKQTVSSGVPGPGAGNLEEPGAIDQYTFSIDAPTVVYFDELAVANCSLLWKCQAPGGALLFEDNVMCVTDAGSIALTELSDYTISVYTNSGATGTYSFKLWVVSPPDIFEIGIKQTVSSGVPGPGAGNLEEPGSIDQYTVEVEPGTLVYFDELAAFNCSLTWKCQAPDAQFLFNNNVMCVTDPGAFLIDQAGAYTITVSGSNGAIGTYSFVLLAVNPTQTFDIGLEQIVSNGVPLRGAGNIEEPAAIDEYMLTVDPNTLVFFDELDADCALQWKCTAPDNSIVFNNNTLCVTDPGAIMLTQGGTYTLRVSGAGGAVGTYSFIVWEVNPPELFDIAIDEVVSDGSQGKGSGNIEEPGAIDRYTLVGNAGDVVCFEELKGPCNLTWNCTNPNDETMFVDTNFCVNNPGKFTLAMTGDYVISVVGVSDMIGPYLLIINTGRVADITGDCHVDVDDLLEVINSWGPCPERPEECLADIAPRGGNGEVDVDDLLAVINDWG